ncbi:MAG: bifunctional helix-turn-helix domain-containing protein/methylated-DNA--[protein]-cysteine S-methyltransferase [Gemmatimonadota bacterium]
MTNAVEIQAMSHRDYDRIQQAIEYLDRTHPKQPSLKDLARRTGLSEFHFQRLFTRWAGVSPKRFIQFQTLEHAKHVLEDSRSLLRASWEVGLSGPARLHDLFVAGEAVTPGSYRAAGEGLIISYGFHSTPFGECLLATTDLGVCSLTFVETTREKALSALSEKWNRANLKRDQKGTGLVVERMFREMISKEDGEVRLALHGTNFQLRVWEALLRIPTGAVASYADVAEAVGAPGASRAVGTAIGQNPIAYLIPCHRVILKTGAFGNYRWGAARKHAILGWEAARKFGEAS